MSGDDSHHGFIPHMAQMGLAGLGVGASGDPDWPTGADIYASSLGGGHHHTTHLPPHGHYGDPSNAVPAFNDVNASLASMQAPQKRSGKRGSGRQPVGLRSPTASDKVEVIICQGTATIIPKSRSTVERRYICNGHPIHRVTFWRHRKHGCPHVTGEGGEGYTGDSIEGVPIAPAPAVVRQKRTAREKADRLIAAEKERELESDEQVFGTSGTMNKFEPPSFAAVAHHQASMVNAANNMNLKMKPMNMSYPLVDAVVDLAPQHGSQYDLRNGFDITPGNVPTQLDASSLGPQVPTFHGSSQPNGNQYGFARNPGQGVMPSNGPSVSQNHSMPPFSLLTDALNLYYAPYRPAELDDEEISSPIHTTYVNHSSPYNSDRSEASDFMEDPNTDGMFKSYLDRSE